MIFIESTQFGKSEQNPEVDAKGIVHSQQK